MKPCNLPAHAKYGPSSMARIMACPASVRLSEAAPPQPESEYAAEGTRAHALAERCLREDLFTVPADFSADRETAAAVKVYLAYIDTKTSAGEDYYIEQRLIHDEELFGTADCLIVSETAPGSDGRRKQHLEVVDYKHGAGVPVEAEGNLQLLTYAGLALLGDWEGVPLDDTELEIDTVTLTIVQPRAPGPAVKSWTVPVSEVTYHMEQVFEAIALSKLETTPGAWGDHCRWCPARITCPILADAAGMVMTGEPKDLSGEELQLMLDAVGPLEARIKSLREYAQQQLEAGRKVPGWKLVAKRGVARWVDESAAAAWFRRRKYKAKDLWTKKLLSPAQARKLVLARSRDELESLIVSESSGSTLAPESDKRDAVVPAAAMDRLAAQMAAINLKH